MVILTSGKAQILSLLDADLYKGGLGIDSTFPISSNSGLVGSYFLVNSCDAIAGWNNEEDAGAEVLNNTPEYFIEGTGCLNIPYTFVAGRGGWFRGIGGSDLSGNHLCVGFFITDKTNLSVGGSCVRILLATAAFADSSYWDFSRDDLYNGWQYLACDVDKPDGTVGLGGTMTNVQNIKIQVHSGGNIGGSDMRLDDWHYLVPNAIGINNSLQTPTTTITSQVLKVSYNVNSMQANYYEYNECGLSLNSGADMLNRQNFVTIRKDNGEEWQITTMLYIE